MSGERKIEYRFLNYIALTVLVIVALVWYPLANYATEEIVDAVIAGIALSVINVLMGYWAIEYSFATSYNRFMQIVLGGIVVRLLVMAGFLAVLVGYFKFHTVALIGSLFGMYIIFLAEEVLYIYNKRPTA